MGQVRHPLSLLALALALTAAGCGSSSDGSSSADSSTSSPAPAGAAVHTCAAAGIGEVRASGVDCARAGEVVSSWIGRKECASPPAASRVSCSVGGYRCLGTATDRGLAVSCAVAGRSLSFTAKRG